MKAIIRIMLLAIVSLIASCSDKDEPITDTVSPEPPIVEENHQWKLSLDNDPCQIIWAGSGNIFAEYHFTIQAPDDLVDEKMCIISTLREGVASALSYESIKPERPLNPSNLSTFHIIENEYLSVIHNGNKLDATKPMLFTLGGDKGLKTTFTVSVPAYAVQLEPESFRLLYSSARAALQITEVVGESDRNIINQKPCLFLAYYCKPEVLLNCANGYYSDIVKTSDVPSEYTVNVPLKVFGLNPNRNGITLSVVCQSKSGKVSVTYDKEHYIPAGTLEYNLPVTFNLEKANVQGEFRALASLRINATGKPLANGESNELQQSVETGTVALCFTSTSRLNIDPSKVRSNDNDRWTDEGGVLNLFDEDPSTYFRSTWRTVVERSEPYGSYIDVELPKVVGNIALEMTGCTGAVAIGPKTYSLYYSNSRFDGPWMPLCEKVTIANPDYSNGKRVWIGGVRDEDWITAPENFKYLRICVLENNRGESLCVPSNSTSNYWNLGELHFFGK